MQFVNDGRVYYYNPHTKQLGTDEEIDYTEFYDQKGEWWYIYAPNSSYFIGTSGDQGNYQVRFKDKDPDKIIAQINELVIPKSMKFITDK